MELAAALKPNRTISMKEGNLKFIQSEKVYFGKGSIEFRWSPEPGYYFTFYTKDSPLRGEGTLITSEGDNLPVTVRWIWRKENNDFMCEGPLRTQIMQGEITQKIDNLSFFISNFYINPLNHLILKYKEWEVLLFPFENINDLFKDLDKNGGYAFTYHGYIRYREGSLFALNEAEFLLEPLRIFLSFMRGAWCKMLFFEGTVNEVNVVAVHPTPLLPPIVPLTRWPRQPEHLVWCNNHIRQDLNKTFNRFMEFYELGQLITSQNQVGVYNQIKSIIINCIESGLATYGETAIILLQSALESLAYMQADKHLRGICHDSFVEANAEVKIRWLLNELSIPTNIPPEAQKLRDYLKSKNIKTLDGPRAITYLRNGIIHATPKLLTRPMGAPSDQVPSEIAMEYTILLGRMYVELSILGMLEYNGNYLNRFTGLTQQVPLKAMALSQMAV
jgi:hypothetical protein